MGKINGWAMLRLINFILISMFAGFGMFWTWRIMYPNLNVLFCISYGCLTSGAIGIYLERISR